MTSVLPRCDHPFPHPHIALLDEILKEWDIDQKSYSVITDNESNMVKAIQSDV